VEDLYEERERDKRFIVVL